MSIQREPDALEIPISMDEPDEAAMGLVVRLWMRGDQVMFEVWQMGPEYGRRGILVWRQPLLPRTYRIPWPRLLAEQLADQVADRDNQGWPELR